MYYNNFKKVLSSSIDNKIFQLDFLKDFEQNTQEILSDELMSKNKDSLEKNIFKIIEKLKDNYKYDTDVVVTFIKGEYYNGNKNKNTEIYEAIDISVQSYNFILCSINKVETPKKALIFDYENKKLTPNSSIDVTVNLNSPIEGFIFPAYENGYSDSNKILYYTSKAKELNSMFVEGVLNCQEKLTAQDEKDCFHSILANVVGSNVKSEILQDIYSKINEKTMEDEETQTISMKDIKDILLSSGVEEVSQLEASFEEFCGSKYDFRIENVVPDLKSKSIKILSDIADITINPMNLGLIKQFKNKEGKSCIVIEINDDVIINGLKLETEDMILSNK